MRFVSTVALGLMLAAGGASVAVSVPAAAKEAAQSQAPKLKLSPEFIPPIRKASDAVAKKDVEGAKAALAEAEPLAKTNDDKYQYYAIMLNLSITAGDGAMQGKAVEGMLATGLVGPEQQGPFNTVAANNALAAKNYDAALGYAEKAQATGYKPEQVYPILAQAIWGKGGDNPAEVARGLAAFKKGIDAMKAANQPVPSQWYQVGVSKAAVAKLPELKQWATWAFDADPSGVNLRTVLRLLQADNPTMTNRENLDLLRLMSVSGGLAVKADYLEYAEMAYKGGLFGEVKKVVDAGRAKGILTATDYSETYGLATKRIAGDQASLGAAAADAAKAADGKIASATADAYMGYGDYTKAIPLYEMALKKGGVDAAEINTHLGISRVLSGNAAGAAADFAKVTGGVRGTIAGYWAQWAAKKPAA